MYIPHRQVNTAHPHKLPCFLLFPTAAVALGKQNWNYIRVKQFVGGKAKMTPRKGNYQGPPKQQGPITVDMMLSTLAQTLLNQVRKDSIRVHQKEVATRYELKITPNTDLVQPYT